MKKYLIIIAIAISLSALSYYFLIIKDQVIAKNIEKAQLVQVGVFTKEKNAYNKLNEIKTGIILYINDKYYVYSHIIISNDILNLVKEYYETNSIDYIIKDININENIKDKIEKYEKLLIGTQNIEVINKSQQDLLNLYKDGLNE